MAESPVADSARGLDEQAGSDQRGDGLVRRGLGGRAMTDHPTKPTGTSSTARASEPILPRRREGVKSLLAHREACGGEEGRPERAELVFCRSMG